MIVDEMHEEHPELLKDQYWEEVVPTELPYTVASEHYRRFEPKGSAEDYKIKEADAMYANIIPSKRSHLEDMYAFADYESVDAPMAEGDDDDENSTPMRNRKNRRKESVRSSSSMYSSNNILKWYRRNSAYSNPDNETAPKPRRSSRNLMHMMKRDNFNKGSKTSLNGSIKISGPLKNRPRIPTPDVSNAPDKKNRFHFTPVAISSGTISPLNKPTSTNSVVNVAGMTLISSQLSSSNGTPVTLLLSPIKESDSNSAHSTLHAGSPTTNALASAVLPQLHANADRKNVISSDLNVSINRPQYIASNFPTIPDFQATSLMNEITTELNDGKKSGDELERKNNELESHAVNGNPSLTSNLTIPLNRQLSIESKLSDSPSLPKRDQLTTSSAPSAHTKSNSIKDEKNEVFV